MADLSKKKLGIMADERYKVTGIVKPPFYHQNMPDLSIRICDPPAWTLASELSERKRIEFTSQAQSMLDHYNKIKNTNFEFVRLVRVQTYLSIENDHYIQFEAKPSGAADHTLKTFEAIICEQFYPSREVIPVTCKLVVPK